jgi:hypothetical protein
MSTKNYKIQSGDSLGLIAQRNNTTEDELMSLNPQIKDRHSIYAGHNIIIPIKEEKKKPKVKDVKEKIAEIKVKTKDSKPEEVYNKQCRIIHVQKVTGPKEITIGESATYEITKYNRTDLTDAEKKKVKWKVEFYSNCNARKVIRSIDDCSTTPSVFQIKNDKLIIKKVPNFWVCCVGIYPYIEQETIAVRQLSKVGGEMNPILIGKVSAKDKYLNKADMYKDLECGDMTVVDFKSYYKAICSLDCERRFKSFIDRTDDSHFESFKTLLTRYSIGDLEDVTLDFWQKMKDNKLAKNEKFTFDKAMICYDSKLSEKAKEYDTDSDDDYQKMFFQQIANLIKGVKGNLIKLDTIGLVGIPSYKTIWTDISGLGILVHGTEGYEVNLIDYECIQGNKFKATIEVNIYDNFGLDKDDIKAGELGMRAEPYKFLSWFYLQRVRGYKPFRTRITYTDIIEGEL